MTNKISLVLIPAALSILLAACGGSGGGGGGDSSSVIPSYTLQLVTLQQDTLTNTNSDECQVYYKTSNTNNDGDYYYYYATEISDPTVALYNADGSFSETLTVNDDGTVQVPEADVPNGGYLGITTITSGQAFTTYNVIAITASMLSSMTIAVTSSDTSGDCIAGTYSESTSSTGYMNINIDSDVFTTAPTIYKLDNGYDDVTTTASNTQRTITVYENHPLLVTAYADYDSDTGTASDMVGYAFIKYSDLCSKSTSCSGVDLEQLDQTPAISFDDADATDSASLKVLNDSAIYDWQTLASSDTEFGYADTLADATWYYKAAGSYVNWDIDRQAAISSPDAGVDVSLLGDLNLSDADPSITTSCTTASYACVDIGGADSSEFNYQRTIVSAYSGTKYVAMQVIGTASDEVVLPQAVDSSGSTIISASALADGSVTVNLFSGSENALFQAQRDDNLSGSNALHYGTVLKTLAQQDSLDESLAGTNILNVSRTYDSAN